MTDELGPVRRTPRPAVDRQTPETGPQESAGTTNTASPVSGDQPAVSSRVSSQGEPGLHDAMRAVLAALNPTGPDPVWPTKSTEFAGYLVEQVEQAFIGAGWRRPRPDHEAALAALRTKLAEEPEILFAGPECDMEAYAALPPCTACEGGGQDTHGTPFEAPLAVHFAGPPVTIAGTLRQLCMWCGHVLLDMRLWTRSVPPEPWPDGALIKIEDGMHEFLSYTTGQELPPGCCALPDDEPELLPCTCLPGCCLGEGDPPNRCEHCATIDGELPCPVADVEPVDPNDGYPVDLCGKHTGNCSNRCLLPAHHDGECDDDPRPDEAQETRAADWPAEEATS